LGLWDQLDQDWVEWLLLPGLACALLAGIAWLGDRRRLRRSNPDAVGFMPWTAVFLWSFIGAVALLGLAARSRFGP
jgi:uncharacterized membrane protein